ncbi:MAG: hypothetical protein MUC67_09970 [Acidobacteria bacterium]|jgi:hypothetical protein|nr:hypothetical protein [Acidobacteriota bacterium]MCU0254894.1 hypothetical protein [Acidobacteriota bacterium]
MTGHRIAPLGALALAVAAIGAARAHDAAVPPPNTPIAGPGAVGVRPARPPAPAGVTDLEFRDLYRMPIGPRGLEYSETARGLAGKKVRLLGYAAQSDRPQPGFLILAPYPFVLHEDEYGLADDLPPAVVQVLLPDRPTEPVPFTPGPLLLTGTLELGALPMPDGRVSHVRLLLDPAPSAGAADHLAKDHTTHEH